MNPTSTVIWQNASGKNERQNVYDVIKKKFVWKWNHLALALLVSAGGCKRKIITCFITRPISSNDTSRYILPSWIYMITLALTVNRPPLLIHHVSSSCFPNCRRLTPNDHEKLVLWNIETYYSTNAWIWSPIDYIKWDGGCTRTKSKWNPTEIPLCWILFFGLHSHEFQRFITDIDKWRWT